MSFHRFHSSKSIATTYLAASALLSGAGSASAQPAGVMFLDGGYPEICEAVAKAIDEPARQSITGSRLDIDPLEICTLAIQSPESTFGQRAGSYNNRSVLKFDAMDYTGALADLDAAIALDPAMGQAHANRGYVLAVLKRTQDAVAAFDQAIAHGTQEQARVYYNRGVAHEELGHVREAYYDYKQASELAPEWTEPQQELTRFSVRR